MTDPVGRLMPDELWVLFQRVVPLIRGMPSRLRAADASALRAPRRGVESSRRLGRHCRVVEPG